MTYKKKIILIFFSFFIFMISLKYIAKDYTITVTESLPLGIYKLSDINEIRIGDIVQFIPEEKEMEKIYKRGYLPTFAKTLLKEVAADFSNRNEIRIKEEETLKFLYVGEKNYGMILDKDSNGREIKALSLEELKPKNKDEYLLLSSHIKSYDSRYFGLIKRENILKKAKIKIKL